MSMASVIRGLAVVCAFALVLGCSGPSKPAPLSGRPAVTNVANGVPLYSDDELRALELKVVTDRDFQAYPLPAVKLAPKTHVEISAQSHTITLKTAAGDRPMPFERVRVIDGPAADLEGWIQTGSTE
jgi:hypothetical protein